MGVFRKKPVLIEAIQWDGKELNETPKWLVKAIEGKVFQFTENGNPVIKTLEGDMEVSAGDYIIKGVKGELYPCKPDVFESTYDKANENGGMTFAEAIDYLRRGYLLQRKGWNGKNLFVFKQVPSHIEEDIIPKMQSIPQAAKDNILKNKKFIDYTSQCIIYNGNTGRADSWIPSISDVFADDWITLE